MMHRAVSVVGRRSGAAILVPAALLLLGAAACAGKAPAAPPAPSQGEPGPSTAIVNASAMVGRCPDSPNMNAKAAQGAIEKLVESCTTVPGGKAHFSATLLPGGKIALDSPEGSAAAREVPICVLGSKLSHKVSLKSPCVFDVSIEERKVPAGSSISDAGAGG